MLDFEVETPSEHPVQKKGRRRVRGALAFVVVGWAALFLVACLVLVVGTGFFAFEYFETPRSGVAGQQVLGGFIPTQGLLSKQSPPDNVALGPAVGNGQIQQLSPFFMAPQGPWGASDFSPPAGFVVQPGVPQPGNPRDQWIWGASWMGPSPMAGETCSVGLAGFPAESAGTWLTLVAVCTDRQDLGALDSFILAVKHLTSGLLMILAAATVPALLAALILGVMYLGRSRSAESPSASV